MRGWQDTLLRMKVHVRQNIPGPDKSQAEIIPGARRRGISSIGDQDLVLIWQPLHVWHYWNLPVFGDSRISVNATTQRLCATAAALNIVTHMSGLGVIFLNVLFRFGPQWQYICHLLHCFCCYLKPKLDSEVYCQNQSNKILNLNAANAIQCIKAVSFRH